MTMTTVVSGRSECYPDWEQLVALVLKDPQIQPLKHVKVSFDCQTWLAGETSFEFVFPQPIDHEIILNHARSIEDGHVMVQTIEPQPAAGRKMERNYDRE